MLGEIIQSTNSLQAIVAPSAILTASLVFKWLTPKVQNDNPPFITTGALHGIYIMTSAEKPFRHQLLELSRKFGYNFFNCICPLSRFSLPPTSKYVKSSYMIGLRSSQALTNLIGCCMIVEMIFSLQKVPFGCIVERGCPLRLPLPTSAE